MSDLHTLDVEMPAGSTRRGFLAGAGAAFVVGFTLPHAGRALAAADTPTFAPNAWLRITPDNRITVICGSAEMGQGVLTAIPQLMAEELDADWGSVGVEQAPANAAYNNPAFGMQATGGSTTIRGHWDVMRNAGATARAMLVAAAAEQWKVPVSECHTESGQVVHRSGKKLTYGALAEAASRQKPPEKVTLKDPKDFKIIGQRKKRLDTVGKTNGSAKYGIDVNLPGMLVAVMARAPLPGAKVVKVDDAMAKAVKGVQQVITLPSGVAVLASGY